MLLTIYSHYIQYRCNSWTLGDHLASKCCYWHFLRDFNLRFYIWPKRFPDSVSQLACSWLFVLSYHNIGIKCHYLRCWLYVIVFLIISEEYPGSKHILQKKVPRSIWWAQRWSGPSPFLLKMSKLILEYLSHKIYDFYKTICCSR